MASNVTISYTNQYKDLIRDYAFEEQGSWFIDLESELIMMIGGAEAVSIETGEVVTKSHYAPSDTFTLVSTVNITIGI